MRTLFMGMPGQFSHIVLDRLLAHSINVAAVLLTGPRNVPLRAVSPPIGDSFLPQEGELDLPLLNPVLAATPTAREEIRLNRGSMTSDSAFEAPKVSASPLALAVGEGIPAFECGQVAHLMTTGWLKELALDVVCVACWNGIIPRLVLDIPRYGFMNVHPSLLPAYRGPFPLFWQFREGEAETGVTLHWMNAGLDMGDIAAQREIQFEDGIRGAEAEALCARSGGDLLAEVLGRLSRGDVVRRPQPSGGTYFPAPTLGDFTLESSWHPRRAFNFMRATAEWGTPFSLEAEGVKYQLRDAVKWQDEISQEPPDDGKVWTSFQGGSLLAEEWSKELK